MRRLLSGLLTGIFFLILISTGFAAEWDRCKVCHRPTGKPAPSKEELLKKFKTKPEFVHAAKSAETPMMTFVKENDELLETVADEIGIGMVVEVPKPSEEDYGINPKKIIETRCTTCHNINRIVYAPHYTASDWLHIVSRMEAQSKGLLTPEEMVTVVDWLYAHHEELKPVEGEEIQASPALPKDTKDLLVKNKCYVCHAGDKILDQAGAWTGEDWEHIIERMRAKAPDLLRDVDTVEISSHLFDTFGKLVKTGAKKVSDLGDLYYRVYGSTQHWGEYRHAYDANNKADDDSGDVVTPGQPLPNDPRRADPRRVSGFWEGKGRIDAEVFDPDKWIAHVGFAAHYLIDEGNDVLNSKTFRDLNSDTLLDVSVEEGWGEVQLPYDIRVRGGIQEYMSDFIGSIYHDTDPGLRIYGNIEGIEWSVIGMQRLENDLVSRLNDTGDNRDQEVYIAHSIFKIGDVLVKPSIHYNDDSEGDHGRGRSGPHEEVQVGYVGLTTYGPIGPFQILTGLYGVFGDQDNATINGLDFRGDPVLTSIFARNPKDNDMNVRAFSGYIDVAHTMLEGMLTPHMGLFYASGDDDPFDDDAEGFDSISDNVNVWGDRGIVIDDRISVNIPSVRAIPRPFLDLMSQPPGVTTLERQASVTVVNDDSPYTALRDRDDSSNFVNPGVVAWNFGITSNPVEMLDLNTNLTYFWWAKTDVLEAVLTANNAVTALLNGDVNPNGTPRFKKEDLNHNIGFEWSVDANINFTKNLALFSGAAIFWWDDEMKQVFGDDDYATDFLLGLQLKF
jgi:hypothetical protein